jgi:gliding motility-associated-like protein
MIKQLHFCGKQVSGHLVLLLFPLFLAAQPCENTIWTEDFGSGSAPEGSPSPYVNANYSFYNFGVQPGNYSTVNFFNYHSSWHVVPEDHTPGDVDGYFMVIDGLGNEPVFYSIQIDNLIPNTDYEFSGWALNMDLPAFQSDLTFAFAICDLNGNELAATTTGLIPATEVPTWTNHGLTFNTGNNTSIILKVIFTSTGYDDFGFDDFELTQLGVSPANNIELSLCPGESFVVNGVVFDEAQPSGSVTLAGASWQGCDSIINVDLDFINPVFNIIQSLCTGESLVVNGTTYDATHPAGTEVFPGASSLGCDSTVNIFLTFNAPSTTSLNLTLCEGDSVVVNGTVFDTGNPSGLITIPNGNILGCDSTVSVNLAFLPNVEASISGGAIICQGDSLALTISINGAGSALWDVIISENGAPAYSFAGISDGFMFWVNPAATTVYTISGFTASGSACSAILNASTTVTVSAIIPDISTSDFNGFGVSCAGSSNGSININANGGLPPYSFQWSTGENQAYLPDLSAGTYLVTVTDGQGCSISTSVELTEPPAMILTAEVIAPLCYGEAGGIIFLDAPGFEVPLQYYSWYEGLFSPVNSFPIVLSALESGIYTITVIDDNDCEAQIEVTVPTPQENSISLGEDLFIALGDSVLLTAIPNFEPDTVFWEPVATLHFQDQLNAQALPFETVTYTVTAIDSNGCVVTDQLTVLVDRTKQIFVPNVFSPNGDGFNDLVQIFANEGQVSTIKVFRIYARWGTLLFESVNFLPNDPAIGWDGNFRGKLMDQGVVTWYMEVEYIDGSGEVLKGDITLIR